MITGAVSCPYPPLLLPGITGAAVDEVEQLRTACRTAIADLLATGPAEVVLLGGIRPTEPGVWYAPDRADPLSLRIGRQLLADAGSAVPVTEIVVDGDLPAESCAAQGRELAAGSGERRTVLLTMADGSARRGSKAPGYLDPRADSFDRTVHAALAGGEPAELAALDAALAAELLVAGRAAWQVLAGATAGMRFDAEVYYAGDPFGVWYSTVRWSARS